MNTDEISVALHTGTPLSPEQVIQVREALDTHARVEEARKNLAAFDWTKLLGLIPAILSALTGNPAAIIQLINSIIAIFLPNATPIPLPSPTPPNGGGGGPIPAP